MMKVKLLNRMAGPGGNFPAGATLTEGLDVSREEILQLIDDGLVNPIKQVKSETAVIPSQVTTEVETIKVETKEEKTNDKPKSKRGRKRKT